VVLDQEGLPRCAPLCGASTPELLRRQTLLNGRSS
jgi:hypothetical protein